jgi:hypothetical protein
MSHAFFFYLIVCLFIVHINYFYTRFEVLVGLTEDSSLLGCDIMSLVSAAHISKNHITFILRIKQWKKNSQHMTKVGVTYI